MIREQRSGAPTLRRTQGILHDIVDLTKAILFELVDPIDSPAAEELPAAAEEPPAAEVEEEGETKEAEAP